MGNQWVLSAMKLKSAKFKVDVLNLFFVDFVLFFNDTKLFTESVKAQVQGNTVFKMPRLILTIKAGNSQ